jgi:voltage-gated potassium channel
MVELGPVGAVSARALSRFIVALIVVNLVAVIAQSVPWIEQRYGSLFDAIELLSLVVFTVEYVLRLWTAPEHPPYRHLSAAAARWRFAVSPSGIVDLVSVLPFWFAFALPSEFRAILVFRIVRFLKIARYSTGVRSLLDALYAERRALFGCVVILAAATMLSATAMYLAERNVQPDKFGTIPDAMWWAIVTLGTIGYGDVVPITNAGKIVAGFAIFGGLMMIALPVGIIANAFSQEIHRRDFVVTWGMVARVPLFEGLSASDIADIMRLLRAYTVEPGAIIARRGEPATSMYFIASGEVAIELPQQTLRLGVGHFFGEVAVMRRARRSATATATTRTALLVLDAGELQALVEREPRINERVQAAIRERVGRERLGAQGDIISEEIEDGGDGQAPIPPL